MAVAEFPVSCDGIASTEETQQVQLLLGFGGFVLAPPLTSHSKMATGMSPLEYAPRLRALGHMIESTTSGELIIGPRAIGACEGFAE